MKLTTAISLAALSATLAACGSNTSNQASIKPSDNVQAANTHETHAKSSTDSKNGTYEGKGAVTKVNLELGSVELKHEEIKGLMPPMTMEFYVRDKASLGDIKVGDQVAFALEYKDGTETITSITKTAK